MALDTDQHWMRLAIELAGQGEGRVEPNPMVGCVLVRDGREIGRAFHARFGGAHAEVAALESAGDARGATAYVSLEPCCHTGKTPPCTDALLRAGVARVVVGTCDPFPQVAGGGIAALRAVGVQVDVGILEAEARRLIAPYAKRIQTGRPWVIAKWAMTLDGKLAAADGSSRWISAPPAREFVHALRGRVDAVIVGALTARRDDPQLTARPPGPRVACRVVFDSRLELSPDSRLAQSARGVPVLLIAHQPAEARRRALESLGCEVFENPARSGPESVFAALSEFGRRGMTNVLVEGGGALLGSFLDARQIDEVIAIVAPKLVGGRNAPTPIAGQGVTRMEQALTLDDGEWIQMGPDLCRRGRVRWEDPE